MLWTVRLDDVNFTVNIKNSQAMNKWPYLLTVIVLVKAAKRRQTLYTCTTCSRENLNFGDADAADAMLQHGPD